MVRKKDYWATVAEQVRLVVEARNIKYLLHFTRLENLPTIFQHGLKSRTELQASSFDAFVSAAERIDEEDDAISASITCYYPKMFEAKRRNAGGMGWAFVFLNASILWQYTCYFHQSGLAKSAARFAPGKRYGHFALQKLFEDDVFRKSHGLPDSCPTHSDAEVQIMAPTIPPDYIVGVWIETEDHAKFVRSALDVAGGTVCELAVQPFTPRIQAKPHLWG